MERIRKSLILLALVAILPAAHSGPGPRDTLCLASGAATFRLDPAAAKPDLRVRIDNDAAAPDLRIQMIDRPELADFVIADDFGATAESAACRSPVGVTTVAVRSKEAQPHVTVRLSPTAQEADFRVYVHSARYSHEDAAALLAATWLTSRGRELAQR